MFTKTRNRARAGGERAKGFKGARPSLASGRVQPGHVASFVKTSLENYKTGDTKEKSERLAVIGRAVTCLA